MLVILFVIGFGVLFIAALAQGNDDDDPGPWW